jgi:transcription elongation factor GreA
MGAQDQEGQDPVLTAPGRERLAAELDELRRVGRPALVEQLRVAREAGGWNSPEYLTVRDELAFVDGRIATLEQLLAHAEVLAPPQTPHPARVGLGTTVTLRDEKGDEERYTIVGPAEVNLQQGYISDVSPVGRAVVGRTVGETVDVRTPGGTRRLTIVQIAANDPGARLLRSRNVG